MRVLFFWTVFHLANMILCVQDLRCKRVSLSCFFILVSSLIGILYSQTAVGVSYSGLILFLTACLVITLFKGKQTIAYADMVYILLCLIILKEAWPVFFIFLGVSSLLIYALTKPYKDKEIPFFPAIYVSFVLVISFF
jgi:hypothetical protein